MDDGTLATGLAAILGGTLSGVGVVDGPVYVDNGGTVAPGDPPGTLTVDGPFAMGAAGNLLIGLDSSTLYDELDVNGAATFGGTLEFDLQDGFMVGAGESFVIGEYDSRGGSTFNAINFSGLDLAQGLTAEVLYDQGTGDNELELVINGTSAATPEPSTWLLIAGGLGITAFVCAARRRNAIQGVRG
jgi:hypothetical protein